MRRAFSMWIYTSSIQAIPHALYSDFDSCSGYRKITYVSYSIKYTVGAFQDNTYCVTKLFQVLSEEGHRFHTQEYLGGVRTLTVEI